MKRKELSLRGTYFKYKSNPEIFVTALGFDEDRRHGNGTWVKASYSSTCNPEGEVELLDADTLQPLKEVPPPDNAAGVRGDGSSGDPTNPNHYANFTVEPIDAIESWGLGYNLASVVAYIARAGRKPAAGGLGGPGSNTAGGLQRQADSGAARPDGHADGVSEPGRSGALDSAVEQGRRLDLRKALRYLIREITALDGKPSWDFADIRVLSGDGMEHA